MMKCWKVKLDNKMFTGFSPPTQKQSPPGLSSLGSETTNQTLQIQVISASAFDGSLWYSPTTYTKGGSFSPKPLGRFLFCLKVVCLTGVEI